MDYDPFINAATLASWAKRPEWATSELATDLLTLASDWIRAAKPDVVDDDPAARVVTYEVTRDALMYGDFGPMTSFSRTMGPRSKSGTLDRGAVERYITDRHRRMLGLSVGAAPRGRFKRCDY